MSDVERLLDGQHDDLALELLRAGIEEGPSEESFKAAALALGLGSAVSVGASTAASGAVGALGASQKAGTLAASASAPVGALSSSLTGALIAKHVLIGAIGGAVAMGGVNYATQRSNSAPAPAVSALQSAPAPRRVAARPPRVHRELSVRPAASEKPVTPPAALNEAPKPAMGSAAVARTAAIPAVKRELPTPPAQPSAAAFEALPEPTAAPAAPSTLELNKSLRIETALLDSARSALLAGNPAQTMRVLEQYRQQRQSTILEPEATVLRIRALGALGQRALAARLARAFIQRNPQSRHLPELRALADDETLER